MMTAQVAECEPFGMKSPGNDNHQLALNIMRRLSRVLQIPKAIRAHNTAVDYSLVSGPPRGNPWFNEYRMTAS